MDETAAEAGGRSWRPSGPIVALVILLLLLLGTAAVRPFLPANWLGGNPKRTSDSDGHAARTGYLAAREDPPATQRKHFLVKRRPATPPELRPKAKAQSQPKRDFGLETSRRTFHAFYNDRILADPERAQLIEFVANVVPIERWKTEDVRSGETVESLIQRLYNLSDETNHESVDVLKKAIKYEGAGSGVSISSFPQEIKSVKVPPVPIKATDKKADVESNEIRLQNFESDVLRSVQDVRDLAFLVPEKLPMDKEPSEGDATMLLLGTYEELINTMRRNGRFILPPDNVRIMRNDGNVDMIVTQNRRKNPGSECSEAKDWAKNNLIPEVFLKKLGDPQKDPAQEGKLEQRASLRNLVIIDWVAAPLYHGKKVESVVHYVLDELLHVSSLKKYVKEIDLNPATPDNRQQLLALLDSYHQDYCIENPGYCVSRRDKKSVDALFADAADWVRKGGDTSDKGSKKSSSVVELSGSEGVLPVRQFVLEAAVWRYLKPASHAWVNMSFAVRTLDSGVTSMRKMGATNSLVFVAARNDHLPEEVTFPQWFATDLSQFVNVSYGTSTGDLLGGYTYIAPPPPTIVVSLAGPGCGYSFESIGKNDLGSSYATPFVASFAWVESLLEDTPPERMREDLVNASAMVPQELTIESAGLFDPSLLFGAESSWFGYAGERPTKIVRGKMRLEYRTRDDFTDVLNCSPAIPCSVLFFQEGEKARVRMRVRGEGDSYSKSRTGDIVKIECTFIDAHNDPIALCQGGTRFPRLLRLVIRSDSRNVKGNEEAVQHDHN
jgi:hypothetical protein